MDYQSLLTYGLRNRTRANDPIRGSVMREQSVPVELNADLPLEPVSPEDWIPNPKSLAMGLAGVVGKGSEKLFAKQVVDALRGPDFKARSTTVNMPINRFLEMAKPLDAPDAEKLANVQSLIKRGVPFETGPALYLNDADNISKVVGHEGRHRAMALRDAGYTHMPVEIRGDIRWSQQGDPTNFDFRGQWPKQLQGEGGKLLPYPLTREEASLPFPEVWK